MASKETAAAVAANPDPGLENELDAFLGDGAGDGAGSGPTAAPETVSVAEFRALQAQLAAQTQQMQELLRAVSEKDRSAIPESIISPAVQNAQWLSNEFGVKFRATQRLKAQAKKMKLFPCEAPEGYSKKKKR